MLSDKEVLKRLVENLIRNIKFLKRENNGELIDKVALDSITLWTQAYNQKNQEILNVIHNCFLDIENIRKYYYNYR